MTKGDRTGRRENRWQWLHLEKKKKKGVYVQLSWTSMVRSSDSSKLDFPEHIQQVTLGQLTQYAGTFCISLDMWRCQASQEKVNSLNSPSACPLTGSLVHANWLGTGAVNFILWLEFRITLEERHTGNASNIHLSTNPFPRPSDAQKHKGQLVLEPLQRDGNEFAPPTFCEHLLCH